MSNTLAEVNESVVVHFPVVVGYSDTVYYLWYLLKTTFLHTPDLLVKHLRQSLSERLLRSQSFQQVDVSK